MRVGSPNIVDFSGLITVNPGAVSYLLVRDAPDGGGNEFGGATITIGSMLRFYSAGYDADSNYVADVNVDWRHTGNLSGFSDTTTIDNLTLFPMRPGSGIIYTENGSAWTDDSTGTITVQSGTLRRIAIRTGPNNGGEELADSIFAAGDTIALYSAGYDVEDNYLGDQNVAWLVEGDTIGFFDVDSGSSNIFRFTTVNFALFRINSGQLSDNSGIIDVAAGAPDSVRAVSATFFSGEANAVVSDDPEIEILDAFNNPVPNVPVVWFTDTGGNLTPAISKHKFSWARFCHLAIKEFSRT